MAIRITMEARGRVPGDGVGLAFGYWPGCGNPIVALHGLTATYANFIGIAESLEGRRPLLGLDLRGRGDSDKPTGPYGFAQHARDVAAAITAMGLGASVVVGHSMGAFVATALSAQNPELVSGLILVDGGYVPTFAGATDAQQGLDSALALRIGQLRQSYSSREAYKEFWRAQPHFPQEEWNPWMEAFLDYEIGGEPPDLRPKASETAVRADLMEGFQRDAIVSRLQSIRVPTIMLRAAAGFIPNQAPLFPDAMIEQMKTYVPAMEVETIPGTTHYTIVMGRRGAARIANLIVELAESCETSTPVTNSSRN